MPAKTLTPEQIIAKSRQIERLMGCEQPVAEGSWAGEISG